LNKEQEIKGDLVDINGVKIDFLGAKNYILSRLENELPSNLKYHNLTHTLEVYLNVNKIAYYEKISNKEDLFLLRTAALYHDCGFLNNYCNHELESCNLASKELLNFGYNNYHINKICKMILATNINKIAVDPLEKIICDADLDYIGRNDYYEISAFLEEEFYTYNVISNNHDWLKIQYNFLTNHKFYSKYSQNYRESRKKERIIELTQKLNLF